MNDQMKVSLFFHQIKLLLKSSHFWTWALVFHLLYRSCCWIGVMCLRLRSYFSCASSLNLLILLFVITIRLFTLVSASVDGAGSFELVSMCVFVAVSVSAENYDAWLDNTGGYWFKMILFFLGWVLWQINIYLHLVGESLIFQLQLLFCILFVRILFPLTIDCLFLNYFQGLCFNYVYRWIHLCFNLRSNSLLTFYERSQITSP